MTLLDLKQLEFIDNNLRRIVLSVEEEFGEEELTSLYRMEDTGVHGQLPLRGIDRRCRNKEFGLLIEKWVNSRWIYDPKRKEKKCCLCHDTGRGLHLHFQTHPSTIRKEDA